MWDKPRELTDYPGNGYETAHGGSGGYQATASSSLDGWKGSAPHNAVILNQNIWADVTWQALGVGIDHGYAVLWFGKEADVLSSATDNPVETPVSPEPTSSVVWNTSKTQAFAQASQEGKRYVILVACGNREYIYGTFFTSPVAQSLIQQHFVLWFSIASSSDPEFTGDYNDYVSDLWNTPGFGFPMVIAIDTSTDTYVEGYRFGSVQNTDQEIVPKLQEFVGASSAPEPVVTPETTPSANGFTVGNVTISNIQLSPASPATLTVGQTIDMSFDWVLQSPASCAYLWVLPNSSTDAYSYSSSDCQATSETLFRSIWVEPGAEGDVIDGLYFIIQEGEDGESYDYTIPVDYTVLGNSSPSGTESSDTSTPPVSNLPTLDSSFSGGIAINGQSSQQSATLDLSDEVEVAGDIAVDPADVGELADIFVYAEATIPPIDDVMYFMLGEGLAISLWDRNPTHLVAFQPGVRLDAMQSVSMYSGRFVYPGTLKIFFGYRLADGTLVQNTLPIDIVINNDSDMPPIGDNGSVDIAGFLSSHNAWRQAAGVPDLTWSDQMAQLAQDWADQLKGQSCAFQHRPNNRYGENLYWASGFTPTAQDVVDSWGSEIVDYDYAANSCTPGQMCGHYTQVVWRDTQTVGCGTATCEDGSILWVCNYDPPGNYIGEKPY